MKKISPLLFLALFCLDSCSQSSINTDAVEEPWWKTCPYETMQDYAAEEAKKFPQTRNPVGM